MHKLLLLCLILFIYQVPSFAQKAKGFATPSVYEYFLNLELHGNKSKITDVVRNIKSKQGVIRFAAGDSLNRFFYLLSRNALDASLLRRWLPPGCELKYFGQGEKARENAILQYNRGYSKSRPYPSPLNTTVENMPSCNGNASPGNTCAEATPVCSFSGFCGTTLTSFTADSWPGLDSAFCGTVQNNAFVKFMATDIGMAFNVWVTSSTNNDGIQLFFFGGNCGSGTVVDFGCYSPIPPAATPTLVYATGFIPGNIYYLMIDGYAGDVCNYVIDRVPSTSALAVTADSSTVCPGTSLRLTATGGSGIYSWTGPGLSANTGSMVTATPVSNAIYTVSSTEPGGLCPVTRQVSVPVRPIPASPIVPDTLLYCQFTNAPPLTATGTSLLWYTQPTGGTGSAQPIIPSTTTSGLHTYWVSQRETCEGPRVAIYTLIKAAPQLGEDKQRAICIGHSIDLSNEFETRGLATRWSYMGNDIPPPVVAREPGIYRLEATNNDGCSATGQVTLSVQQGFQVFAGNDSFAVKGETHQLQCSPAASYAWSPAGPLDLSNIQNPVAILENDQQFIVEAVDAAGCLGRDTVLIRVFKGPAYYVPNAFTPNGDGLNDLFRPVPVGIAYNESCRIFDRYGNIVFETSRPYDGWNGTSRNVKQPAGSYVWFLKGKDRDGKKLELKGTVVLVR